MLANAQMTGIQSASLLEDFSFEMTGKEIKGLTEAAQFIPPGTQISVAFLPNEDFPARIEAASAVRQAGCYPVPHISARRLTSEYELTDFLQRLTAEASVDRAFVIAGDPPQPRGPYFDSLAILKTGLLSKFGIKKVGISGYPDGHSEIPQDKLWTALREKADLLTRLGHETEIVTQFCFDVDPVLAWLKRVREFGITVPVRIGVPGPTSVKSLLRFAATSGVAASAKVMSKYGASIMQLLTVAGPEAFIEELQNRADPAVHGEVKLHFYTFGALRRTAEWMHVHRAKVPH